MYMITDSNNYIMSGGIDIKTDTMRYNDDTVMI